MHSRETVDSALDLLLSGLTIRETARRLGIPERTVAHWSAGDRRSKPKVRQPGSCPRCNGLDLGEPYTYLLGMYLGDGHITTARNTNCLWVYCADDWPGVQEEVRNAMRTVMPSTSVSTVQRTGCVAIKSFTVHWTCLLPQHGSGLKHTRRIVLEPWQQEVVDQHTGAFLRGLFHSDGCRITNWASRRCPDGTVRRYEYPRYFFSNESADILDLCSAALDRLSVAHRRPKANTISVARREAVAVLDTVVGPKH